MSLVSPMDASGFVSASHFIPDVLLDVRYHSTFNFVASRVDGYEEPLVLLTRKAAEALRNVNAEAMRMGLRLKLFDGYRPQRAVEHFVRWAKETEKTETKAVFYPDVDKRDLFSLGFIASRSGHSRGSTIDLTLFDMQTQRDLDMGGGFDFFGELSWSEYTRTLTQEQIENRRLLREMMVRHGFRPLSEEWWHFTLIDEPYPDTYFDFPVSMKSIEAK